VSGLPGVAGISRRGRRCSAGSDLAICRPGGVLQRGKRGRMERRERALYRRGAVLKGEETPGN
jgi:hypothetical protein